jgi:hypothetical protein
LTADGGCVLLGHSDTYYALRLDSNGHPIWQNPYQETDQSSDPDAIIPLDNGNFAFFGDSYSSGDFGWLLTVNGSEGSVIVDTEYGSNVFDEIYSGIQDRSSGYFLCGGNATASNYSAFTVARSDSAGHLKWRKSFGDGFAYGACLHDQTLVVVGEADDNVQQTYRLWVMYLDTNGNSTSYRQSPSAGAAVQMNSGFEDVVVYPNPVVRLNPSISISASGEVEEAEIVDVLGVTLSKTDFSADQTHVLLQLGSLPAGPCLLRIKTSVGVFEKVLIVK